MELSLQDGVAIPAITALVEVAKGVGMPSNWSPVLAIALGVGYGLLVGGLSGNAIATGIVFGLSASGLYSGQKKVLAGIKKN